MTPTQTRLRRARRLVAGLAVLALAAGCSGNTGPTLAPAATLSTTTATPTPGPTSTPIPTPSQAPTIGQPADDGARIIAVDSPTALAHLVLVGDTWVADGSPLPTTRARDLTIDSPAVGLVHVRLLLPHGFDAQPATRWPVLYLLHGGGGKYSDWTEIFDVEALTAPTNLLVVMPDGGTGWYSDWWNGGNGGSPMWETFHLVELRQLLERNWQAGDKRAIAGMSMGGYGAMEYATRNPGMFLFAGSFSGPLDPLHGTAVFPFLIGPEWGDPVAQANVWKAHDPLVNAAGLKGTALFVAYGNGTVGPLDSGKPSPWDADGSTEREMGAEGAAFVNRLAQLKIPVTVYAYGNGTHFEPYFQRDLHLSFPLILEALGE
jgi:diacylglycerol O-acyltransferase / trehalose O-mycolyltransferase